MQLRQPIRSASCWYETQILTASALLIAAFNLTANPISAQNTPHPQSTPAQQRTAPKTFQPMTPAERAARFDSNLNRWQKESGLDPNTAQILQGIYQSQSSSNYKIPQSVAEFAKQAKYGQTTKTNSPPSDFPVPVFKGTNTQYVVRPNISISDSHINMTMSSLSFTTSDSGKSVSSWYKSALAQAGWKVIDPLAAATNVSQNSQAASRMPGDLASIAKRSPSSFNGLLSRGGISFMEPISAQKSGLQCSIQITEYSSPQRTEVNVSAGKP